MLKEVLILGLVVCVLQKDIIYVKGRVVQNGHGYLSDEEYRKVMKVIEKYNKMNLGSGLKMNVYRINSRRLKTRKMKKCKLQDPDGNQRSRRYKYNCDYLDEGVQNDGALIKLRGRVSQRQAVSIDKKSFDRVKRVIDSYNKMHKDNQLDIAFEEYKG